MWWVVQLATWNVPLSRTVMLALMTSHCVWDASVIVMSTGKLVVLWGVQ
jgi:hypothetical protein